MVRHRQVLLNFLELRRVDLRERILFAVHHAGLQRDEDFGESHRRRARAVCLEHLHAPFTLRNAKLDALQILGRLDRVGVVRDLPEPVVPDGDDLVAGLLGLRSKHRPDDLLLDPLHVLAVADEIRHLEQAERRDHGRHDRRGHGEVERPQLHLLHHLRVVAELARTVELDDDLPAKLLLDAFGELLGSEIKQGPRGCDVSQLELERLGGNSGSAEEDGGEGSFHGAA